ncbi:DUF3298 domain-containing protein [Nitratifractor sp.]
MKHRKTLRSERWIGLLHGLAVTIGVALLSLHPLKAEDRSYLLPTYGPASVSMDKRFCRNAHTHVFCLKCSIYYPDGNVSDAPPFYRFIPKQITDVRARYRRCGPAYLEGEEVPEVDWYEHLTANVTAITPKTYTLLIADEGFTGGAHGFHSFEYRNYLRESGRRLGYKDLFKGDFNRTLTAIAERVYRRSKGLAPDADLSEEAGWLENRFVLPENFAITTRGLLLSYNTYEVTPYAAEPPEFLLPYSQIRSLIDPKGPLAFALDPDHAVTVDDEEFDARIHLSVAKIDARTLELNATLRYFPNADIAYKRSWFTLQFPGIKGSDALLARENDKGSRLAIYPAGSRLYNYKAKKHIHARWLEVELTTTDTDDEWTVHRLRLRLRLPRKRPFVVYYRFARQRQDGTIDRLDDTEKTGQQGLPNALLRWGE